MTHESLREFLEQQYHLYNTPDFIINDPVSIPHKFTKLQDIEIIGFGQQYLHGVNALPLSTKRMNLFN